MRLAAVLGLPLILLIAGGMAWIRLAPDDPVRWNVADETGATADFPLAGVVMPVPGGAVARLKVAGSDPAKVLGLIEAMALATPRTTLLAGAPGDGRMTFVTRSAVFGFPDYSTASAVQNGADVDLSIRARQRYGKKDLGVNAARLQDWLTRLAGGTTGG